MVFQFGACRLDVESRQLVRAGREQHLTPKAFDLLVALVQARPAVVSKADLMNLVWPETFVCEGNLPVIVGEVRLAIGDSARAAQLLRTHHGRGYSFTDDVVEVARLGLLRPMGPTPVLRVGTRRVALAPGSSVIGRDRSADVVINDASVSRHHARITIDGSVVDLQDLESKNGTRVDGERITSRRLASGDVLCFGAVEAEFEVEVPSNGSTCTLSAFES